MGWEDLLEEEMATHSSILAWEIPWTEEPGGLYSPWSFKESNMMSKHVPELLIIQTRREPPVFTVIEGVGFCGNFPSSHLSQSGGGNLAALRSSSFESVMFKNI